MNNPMHIISYNSEQPYVYKYIHVYIIPNNSIKFSHNMSYIYEQPYMYKYIYVYIIPNISHMSYIY